jgi:hypothetical protein
VQAVGKGIPVGVGGRGQERFTPLTVVRVPMSVSTGAWFTGDTGITSMAETLGTSAEPLRKAMFSVPSATFTVNVSWMARRRRRSWRKCRTR